MLSLLILLTVALPLVWAWQRPPQPAFVSQALSCGLWAVVVLIAALHSGNSGRQLTLPGAAASLVWALLLATLLAHALLGVTPWFLAAPIAVNLSLAALLSWVVLFRLDDHTLARAWSWLLAGLLIAALLNALVALVQTAAPAWADDRLIASLAGPHERAGGNLRQPNQLATLMVWGLVAATSLLRRWPLLWFSACATLTLAVLASGSRAGIISLVAVAMIGAFVWLRSRHRHDANGRSNGKWHRQPWLAGVLVILLLALLGWAAQHAFSRDTADASLAQRLALWQQTLGLIMQHPWAGVGWAQLNFVWTLTPFADRAPDVFDHAHSLPLHLAVELGIPVTVAAATLVIVALWPARVQRAVSANAGQARIGVAALLLLSIGTHSLFEYPLWFSYFLLPTAFVLATLARDLAATPPAPAASTTNTAPAARLTSARLIESMATLLLIATGWGAHEYSKASAIHFTGNDQGARADAVAAARASPLYGQYGDYAAIMLAGDRAPLEWFARPIRNVLDERLLTAWARALQRAGQHERAAWVVARAREFPPDAAFAGLPQVTAPLNPASAPRSAEDFRR